MSIIQIQQQDNQLVVDSRLIAAQLEIKHKTFLDTIRKYETEMEKEFGCTAVETADIQMPNGGTRKELVCYWLTEDQATYVMTLSRNTDSVRRCKRELVKAFSAAKQIIPQQSGRIRELELENENLRLKKDWAILQETRINMHGLPIALMLEGKADAVVEVEVPLIEVIDERCNVTYRGQTLKQLAEYLHKVSGRKYKSGAELKRHLEKLGKGHLIAQTPRTVLGEYIPDDNINEVLAAINQSDRQMLIGE